MLAVSPLRSNKDGNNREGRNMEANFTIGADDFPDFSGSNLLDSIDFDDLFMGIHDGDVLPDLEMDPELLAEFSVSGGDDSELNNSSSAISVGNIISPTDDGDIILDAYEGNNNNEVEEKMELVDEEDNNKGGLKLCKPPQEDIDSKKEPELESTTTMNSSFKENDKLKKSSMNTKKGANNNSNNNQGKRKTKVDWTPELHRRFVQAVEQLGVDKAVPSRILELMGIDCLTRHNVASHLQKYRSHRKHLLAREAEAASWTQKRQIYGVATGAGRKGGANIISLWHPPTMGFPPPMTTMHAHPPFRPLHVWGHPTMDPQTRLPMWPKQVVPPMTPVPTTWAPPPPHPPPVDSSFWHSSHPRRVAVPPVPGIPPHAMYRPEHGVPPPLPSQSGSHPPFDLHPSNETIDAAIGDVLSKPWSPLPIGLKPPSMDSVLVELQRQGIPKIPPSCA